MQRLVRAWACVWPGPGPYPVSSASSSCRSSEPRWPGVSAISPHCACDCSSGRFLGRLPWSPHPQPGFTSPFRLQVEVWSASGLGLGCCFLICCCKRRREKKHESPGSVEQVAGPRGGGEAEVQGVGAGTLHRSPPPTCSPGLEVQLCTAAVPRQRAWPQSLSLHMKRGDLPGGHLLGALPEHGPLSRTLGLRLAHPSLAPALQTSGAQPESPCLQEPPHPPPCSLTVFFTFLNCWGLSAAPGLCQPPWLGDSGLARTTKHSPDPGALHRVSSLPIPTLKGPETTDLSCGGAELCPQIRRLESHRPAPQNGTLFGNRVTVDAIS